MDSKLTKEEKSVLLARRANSPRSSPPLKPSGRFEIKQVLFGLSMGVPLGVSLYYVSVCVFYPIVWVANMGMDMLPWRRAIGDIVFQQLGFGPGGVFLLATACVAMDIFCTRREVTQGRPSFALAQAPLSIITVLALFALTLIKHTPLLPFVGQ